MSKKIGIILGSTRTGRLGERVSKWVMRRAALLEGIEPILLDLADYQLPFFAEATPPAAITEYQHPEATRWSAAVAELDGFVVITPEYNHGYPAVLKNALDYLYKEWVGKPVTVVSYSPGMVGGARAAEQLRLVLLNLRLVVLPISTNLGKADTSLGESGEAAEALDGVLDKQLTELATWVTRLAA